MRSRVHVDGFNLFHGARTDISSVDPTGLESRGVEFDDDVVGAGFGLMTHFKMPGGVRVMLYQPHYEKGAG